MGVHLYLGHQDWPKDFRVRTLGRRAMPVAAGRTVLDYRTLALSALNAFPSRAVPALPVALLLGAASLFGADVAAMSVRSGEGGGDAARVQWDALAIGPLSRGGRTGLRLTPTAAVEPIEVAPERTTIEFSMTVGAGDSIAAAIARGGGSLGDAQRAAALIRAAASEDIQAGTPMAVTLGAKSGPQGRSVERIALSAGLGLKLIVARNESGALEITREQAAIDRTPLRVRGQVGDGLYWSLRAAGVSPLSAAEYLRALATQIDVGGDIGRDDRFDLVVASSQAPGGPRQTGALLYAGLDRAGARDIQMMKWNAGGRTDWIEASSIGQQSAGMTWPVAARITSRFGYRIHPILRFARFHRGVDFGAGWGTPIVAAADGRIVGAGWSGGYGRQVKIAHAGGLATTYSHMSRIVAEAGGVVRQGQLIGYVGSTGLSTGPHLHYEVFRDGQAVDPLSVRFTSQTGLHGDQANAFKSRLRQLLSIGGRKA